MGGSSKFLVSQSHLRSISLPSRFSSNSFKIESELNKLKTSVLVASSTETIQNALVGIADLYNCIEDQFIQSSRVQQVLLQGWTRVLLEDMLEGSIGLLDSCSTLKDLLSEMKENVQTLQSELRRKHGDMSNGNHITAYLSSRKKGKKIMAKSLRVLKQMENKIGSSLPLDVDPHLLMVIRILREVYSVTIVIFRSVLNFLSCSKTKSSSRWSFISTMMVKSLTVQRDQSIVNEVECVDLALCSLRTKVDVENALGRMQKLDTCIESFEGGVDCLFRLLIQSRASLLNTIAS